MMSRHLVRSSPMNLDARLANRRNVGEGRRALGPANAENAELAAEMKAHGRADIVEKHVDSVAHDILQRRRGAAIGNMHHPGAGQFLEQDCREMRRRPVSLRGKRDFARIGSGVGDQLLNRLRRKIRTDIKHIRCGAEHGDRHQIGGTI
jgi:hypothetical protein